jgi:NAD(P)H-quinone oxidoreductase subunit 5
VLDILIPLCVLAPAALMALMAAGAAFRQTAPDRDARLLWRGFLALSGLGLSAAVALLAMQLSDVHGQGSELAPWATITRVGSWLAVLVQLLGTIIGAFSARYLQGEPGQARYVSALSGVLAAVQTLLLADHWLVLIAAWALAGTMLQPLLCFYRDRSFALLAAHKKRIADRTADLLLIAGAIASWHGVGSGSISELLDHVERQGSSLLLDLSAVCLTLAVIVRTAALPVHGWMIQVMEAPTPVSALLHAGVVNLGGFVLIRFAGLLEAVPASRWLLIAFGLATAVLAGFAMLTRVSIKVRLAWSTVAQMGFLLLECGLGLYHFAALHLIGHSLYKAHAFLSSSQIVRQTRIRAMIGDAVPERLSFLIAPLLAFAVIASVERAAGNGGWPLWWTAILAFAWAPLLWAVQQADQHSPAIWRQWASGCAMIALLAAAASLGQVLPLGAAYRFDHSAGLLTLTAMAFLYIGLAVLRARRGAWSAWRRWSYAGFYVDEIYTRLALRLWPASWGTGAARATTTAWPAPSFPHSSP